MGMDLSYLEQLMGGASESGGGTGGVWVVSPDGALDDGMLRLVGKARTVADALGGYVYLLAGCGAAGGDPQRAIRAGADNVLTANGMPGVSELADFLREREPQAVLFPRTQDGRLLAGGLAQVMGGALCTWAADVAVDPIYQRVVVHQPVLGDAARQIISLTGSPGVVVVDTALLPAGFDEPWRTGTVEDTALSWPEPAEQGQVELPTAPLTLRNAPVIVAAGMGLRDEPGFALAQQLAEALGGVVAGMSPRWMPAG
jgi:electron transfer flavoprotein alpha subunit